MPASHYVLKSRGLFNHIYLLFYTRIYNCLHPTMFNSLDVLFSNIYLLFLTAKDDKCIQETKVFKISIHVFLHNFVSKMLKICAEDQTHYSDL